MKQRASLRELPRRARCADGRASCADHRPESLAELIEQAAGEDDPYEVVKLAKRVLSLPSQVTMFKDLIAAEKSVQDMERKAFRMDAEEQGSGIEALLERIGSRNENPALGRALWGCGWSVDFNSIGDARLFVQVLCQPAVPEELDHVGLGFTHGRLAAVLLALPLRSAGG